jgi:hypothetical protein
MHFCLRCHHLKNESWFSSSSEEDSNCVIFRLNPLDFQANAFRLATVLFRAFAIFDFPDVEDKEDGFSSGRFSSTSF